MFQFLTLLLAVLGAIGGSTLVYQCVVKANRKRKRSRSFLGDTTARYIAIGSTPDGGKTVRKADNEGLAEIRVSLGQKWIPPTCQTPNAVKGPALHKHPLVVLGSPRLNTVADDLQKRIELPFEFVSLTPKLPPAKSVLCIYKSTGQEYVCSSDPCHGEVERQERPRSLTGHEEDYGLLVVGELTDPEASGQRIIWAAGIHGIGTLGVVRWVRDNIDAYDWNQLGNVCFLIRVGFTLPKGEAFDAGGPHETIENTDPQLIAGPCRWQPRPQLAPSPSTIGILCDMGSVLLPFDRRRFEHNLRHLLGIKNLSRMQRKQIDELQARFEVGDEDARSFLEKMRQCLGRTEADVEAIKLAWNDIFWRNEPEIWLLNKCQSRGVAKLVLISNTDSLRLDHALSGLNLHKLFDREHVVASFHPGVRPKGVDNSMLTKGLEILERDCSAGKVVPVFIDDVRDYLVTAREGGLGVNQVHFRTFAQLVCELRRYGIYERISESW